MMIIFLITTGWPLAPQDSTQPLGNNWGEFQDYGGVPYLHSGIDVMGITIERPVYAVQSGVVKAWLTISGDWHWRLAIADYETTDSVEAWLYAHIDPNQYHKNIGDSVAESELIGYLVWWPVNGFDHLHFARIKDAGAVWEYGDWAFVKNPLVIIEPYDDTTKPVFENAYGNNLFAFCQNNTSNYLQPDSLTGNVDVIAKIYDDTGLPLPDPVWERLIPFKIEYEIHGQQNVPVTLSFIFHGVLDLIDDVDIIYKDDAVCDTRGDYVYRDYFFIVTNTDADSVVELTDAAYSWVTTDYPDGDYWVVVTAYDAANNFQTDSMLVTINNLGIKEQTSTIVSQPFTIAPNPRRGVFIAEGDDDVRILDVCGRFVAAKKGVLTKLTPGIYFVVMQREGRIATQKLVIIE